MNCISFEYCSQPFLFDIKNAIQDENHETVSKFQVKHKYCIHTHNIT